MGKKQCDANPEPGSNDKIAGFKFEESLKRRCVSTNNLVFENKFSSTKSCSKKCANDPTCMYFASSTSKYCAGYKTCNEKEASKEVNKIFKKGK